MIERHETILDEYTDEHLTADLGHHESGVRERAALLLTAPPEYRQGVEAAAHAMAYTLKSRPSSHNKLLLESYSEPTGVQPEDARRAALDQLAAQGVKLNPVPA